MTLIFLHGFLFVPFPQLRRSGPRTPGLGRAPGGGRSAPGGARSRRPVVGNERHQQQHRPREGTATGILVGSRRSGRGVWQPM